MSKQKNSVNYPWYSLVSSKDGLSQGDFIFNSPILEPNYDLDEKKILADYSEYNVIIMSQSCDLINKKLNNVLVCPYWQLEEIEEQYPWFKSNKNKEKLRRGDQPNYHLLNECHLEEYEFSHIVVDFRDVYSVPFSYATEYSQSQKKRLRLLSPYIEHLAQAFARFFMRVGLPIDIDPFV
ncbi:MAG: hypothetical protein JW776_16960 [Candidatus Lokiarchaeota archaeon]|nr:hypothetical protein [Candidatus Lokiarchaeota archaeon]